MAQRMTATKGCAVKLRYIRVSPSFFSEQEAVAALKALHGRIGEPGVAALVDVIWLLAYQQTILPGRRWP
jgi:hypothetical protein